MLRFTRVAGRYRRRQSRHATRCPSHLEPVLQALVRGGILRGIRGPHGGYELGRKGDQISADDIPAGGGAVEDCDVPPLPGSAQGRSAGTGRDRADFLRRAGPDRHQRHDQARRGPEITPKILNSCPFMKHVHGLDSFGAIRLGGKVERFAARRGGRRPHLWGKPECRSQSGRRTRGCVLVRGEADSSPPSSSQVFCACAARRSAPRQSSAQRWWARCIARWRPSGNRKSRR